MTGFRIIIAVFAALAASIASAAAQDWPVKPVTMVYPFAAGSAADVLGRVFASRLSEILGQPVIFENVGGAGGMTGANRVAKGAADGHQLLLGGNFVTLNQTLYKNPPYNVRTDLVPVALIVEQPIVLIARNDLPVSNLPEFIAYAKANQGKMQYGSTGVGSIVHLGCALLNARIGIETTHIPYRGGGPIVQDLIAGRIDYACPLAALAIPQIESKKVKAIAIFSKSRLAVLPELASAQEQGLTDFDVVPWYAFFLPKDTPSPIVQKLNAAVTAAMETPAVQAKLKMVGYTFVERDRRSPEYLRTFVDAEIKKWAAAIEAAGIAGQ
jgi:tripartite-type tricarboxylate transporter receptor subunit TctC